MKQNLNFFEEFKIKNEITKILGGYTVNTGPGALYPKGDNIDITTGDNGSTSRDGWGGGTCPEMVNTPFNTEMSFEEISRMEDIEFSDFCNHFPN